MSSPPPPPPPSPPPAPPAYETSIQVGPLLINVTFSTPLDALIPSRFLPSSSPINASGPFPEEQQRTRGSNRFPATARGLSRLTRVPSLGGGVARGFREDFLNDHAAPETWRPADDQELFLGDLMTDVGRVVEDQLCWEGQLSRDRYQLKVQGPNAKLRPWFVIAGHVFRAPSSRGYVDYRQVETRRRSTQIVAFAATSPGDTPRAALGNRIEILLSQTLLNLRHEKPHIPPAEEAFVVAMHGKYLHIVHGLLDENDISIIRRSRQPPEDHRLRVSVSRDYNMLGKTDFLEATRGLAGMFAYLLSKEAKVAGLRKIFEAEEDARLKAECQPGAVPCDLCRHDRVPCLQHSDKARNVKCYRCVRGVKLCQFDGVDAKVYWANQAAAAISRGKSRAESPSGLDGIEIQEAVEKHRNKIARLVGINAVLTDRVGELEEKMEIMARLVERLAKRREGWKG